MKITKKIVIFFPFFLLKIRQVTKFRHRKRKEKKLPRFRICIGSNRQCKAGVLLYLLLLILSCALRSRGFVHTSEALQPWLAIRRHVARRLAAPKKLVAPRRRSTLVASSCFASSARRESLHGLWPISRNPCVLGVFMPVSSPNSRLPSTIIPSLRHPTTFSLPFLVVQLLGLLRFVAQQVA
jgi:hypothetical protein